MEPLFPTSIPKPTTTTTTTRPPSPPPTPLQTNNKRRHDPPSSPASIHPHETTSPTKTPNPGARKKSRPSSTPTKRTRTTNPTLLISELHAGDVGYLTNPDEIVYPAEFEEVDSEEGESDGSFVSVSDGEGAEAGLTRRLSRLRCGDDREVWFEKARRRRHAERRGKVVGAKRGFGESLRDDLEDAGDGVQGDFVGVYGEGGGATSVEVEGSQRKVRRRVRAPWEEEEGDGVESLRSSIEPPSRPVTPTPAQRNAALGIPRTEGVEAMDVDDS